MKIVYTLNSKKSLLFLLLLVTNVLFIFCKENRVEIETDQADFQSQKRSSKTLKYEVKSIYSHIKVYDENQKRFLCFVRDNGDEVIESSIDILHPEYLQLKYTQAMFGSFLLKKRLPRNTLLIGLGGGGMPLFLYHYFPEVKMKIVEIDKEIIDVSKKLFFINENIIKNIINEDAFLFLKKDTEKYDIIFMDAFLKPSKTTDETGISYKFKENSFYENLKQHLTEEGIVVFNINHYLNFEKDIKSINENFKNLYIINRKGSGNYIIIASTQKNKLSKEDLNSMAGWIDKDRNPNYSFVEMVDDFKEVSSFIETTH